MNSIKFTRQLQSLSCKLCRTKHYAFDSPVRTSRSRSVKLYPYSSSTVPLDPVIWRLLLIALLIVSGCKSVAAFDRFANQTRFIFRSRFLFLNRPHRCTLSPSLSHFGDATRLQFTCIIRINCLLLSLSPTGFGF